MRFLTSRLEREKVFLRYRGSPPRRGVAFPIVCQPGKRNFSVWLGCRDLDRRDKAVAELRGASIDTVAVADRDSGSIASAQSIRPEPPPTKKRSSHGHHHPRHQPEGKSSSTAAVYVALIGDVLVAISKAGAAIWTGSAAMTSEAIHSIVDTTNEVLSVVRNPSLPTEGRYRSSFWLRKRIIFLELRGVAPDIRAWSRIFHL